MRTSVVDHHTECWENIIISYFILLYRILVQQGHISWESIAVAGDSNRHVHREGRKTGTTFIDFIFWFKPALYDEKNKILALLYYPVERLQYWIKYACYGLAEDTGRLGTTSKNRYIHLTLGPSFYASNFWVCMRNSLLACPEIFSWCRTEGTDTVACNMSTQ